MGSRIAWDFGTLVLISEPAGGEEASYARMIEFPGGILWTIYESVSAGTIILKKSLDQGRTWGSQTVLFKRTDRVSPATPEFIRLAGGIILAVANLRPQPPYSAGRPFSLAVIRSVDQGVSWSVPQIVYRGGCTFENGVWEPVFLELPSGEVQIYFSDESPYTASNEQNISLLRSFDQGQTWTSVPEIISFQKGKRDGMSVPVLADDRGEILYSLEDNKDGVFKPSLITEPLLDNWTTGPVSGTDIRRKYSFVDQLGGDRVYSGSPYLVRLASGEFLLSVQTTLGRSPDWSLSQQMVFLGTSDCKKFSMGSAPFEVPMNQRGLWNALTVLADGGVFALSSTTAYSGTNQEIWAIRGRVIPEQFPLEGTPLVDGILEEGEWPGEEVFVGQRGTTSVTASFLWDSFLLYFSARVYDSRVYQDSLDPLEDDGLILSLDNGELNSSSLVPGLLSVVFSPGGGVLFREVRDGKWITVSPPAGFNWVSRLSGDGYIIEAAVPWEFLGGRPGSSRRMGMNLTLLEDSNGGSLEYRESISSQDDSASFTWLSLFF